ncbi:putative HTH transcriptional regulator [Sulfolobus spindle-shaped virus 6]|uniref:Putative HTH transcriptional regulator n=1 Tax=Sulfolobus spindle-shaped virus 6 TaxID=693627 RepID=D1GF49_9VIRU|nr:transcriptional regulator [Sulfolobus spindle-shaped virus 6]ACZ35750.1 putative HTH transcriptional regulator [Sulfolobus spindle-shaped virus 6]
MARAYANILKGELTRRKILKLLAENYALSVAFISHSVLLSYTATMKHLKILKEQDLIEMWEEQGRIYVALKEKAKELKKELSEEKDKN